MIESLFVFESTRSRQRSAPLLKEREQYLSYMIDQGVSKQRVRTIASMLLHIIRLMELSSPRSVDMIEIQRASQLWLTDTSHKMRRLGESSVSSFTYTARNWLRFHNLINTPVVPAGSIEVIVNEFLHFLNTTRGMSPQTTRTYGSRVFHFLTWAMNRNEQLSTISVANVDDYLERKRIAGWLPRTIAGSCAALRMFFRYAEVRGWSESKLAPAIYSPRIARYDAAPLGPTWKDVRRLLDSKPDTTPAGLRAAAIFSLCAIYAIRRTEIVSFMLSDFDWVNETFTVMRAKRGRVQQFPIQFDVGETILRYLQHGRPPCSCRHLFVTLRPPYRPVSPATLWGIICLRMKRLGITSEHFGAHSLRHACATQLLNKGSSLRDIADFLGHRDMKSVSIYAKYDVRSLRQVAAFSLAGVK
jgi:site-specific recombinase XerD